METAQRITIILGRIVLAIGLVIFAAGVWLETRNPRTSEQDAYAWVVLHVGTSVLGVGFGLRFAPFPSSIPAAVILGVGLPYMAFSFGSVFYICGGATVAMLLLFGFALAGIFKPVVRKPHPQN